MADHLSALQNWVCRDVFKRGMSPLSSKIKIRIDIGEHSFTLTKTDAGQNIVSRVPVNPDISFFIPESSFQTLIENRSEEVATVGISILKHLIEPNPNLRAYIKVHLGLFDLMRLGYLSVLPLGGPTMVKFLASQGINGIGKLKEVISKLRNS